jgi:signal peptidase II
MFSLPSLVLGRQFILLTLLVLVLDQLTKSWALSALFVTGQQIVITPFFNLTPVWNSGISFGLLADFPSVTGLGIPVFALLVVAWLYLQLSQLDAVQRFGAGFIAGGALGNVIDRLRFERVIDFIDLHLLGYHWPAFNIADSAIFIGVVAWLYGIMSAPKSEGDTHA